MIRVSRAEGRQVGRLGAMKAQPTCRESSLRAVWGHSRRAGWGRSCAVVWWPQQELQGPRAPHQTARHVDPMWLRQPGGATT
ncbi:hypothetical protein GUJ93_ZPchr0002g24653 [Zizania palustris]|uniref:Uncharacterized protein n=1 Tax=Zizania palustris TaxID=103762 RepID=A0A8J5S651_ZIZPA|nr:hypothetical protein GUJ93_ZPchr0002g24653 [Zizania palustris]